MSEGVSEERIREIVRDELQKSLLRTLNETLEQIRRTEEHLSKRQEAYEGRMGDLERNIRELAEVTGSLAKTAQENTKAIEELRITVTELGKRTEENTRSIQELGKRTEENTKAIEELRITVTELGKRTEENTRSIQELGKRTEENTKAIEELRITVTELGKRTEENTKAIEELRITVTELGKRTEENTKAIEELRITVTELGKRTEENTKAITGLVRAVKNLNKRVGGLENTFGLIVESSVNSSLVPWFRSIGVNVDAVSGKTLLLNGRLLEFDTYVETEGKIFVGEIKTTLREDDVTHFHEKIVILKTYLGGKDVVPFMVYRNKYSTKRGDPIAVAKTLGIKVLKYTKGGGFFEAGSQ